MNEPAERQDPGRHQHRKATYPVAPLFLKRWSPRAFAPMPMPIADLYTMLEAARWAPSAYNIQPWRFIYFTRGSAGWLDAIGLLDVFNAGWAKNASAIVFVVSERLIAGEDLQTPKPSQTHSFDTGAAWAQLALQATALGYQAHAMAGLHFDQVRRKLAIPDSFHVEIAVAIGREAKPSILPPSLQQREIPSSRLPLNEIVFAECFSAQAVDMAPRPSGTEGESRT